MGQAFFLIADATSPQAAPGPLYDPPISSGQDYGTGGCRFLNLSSPIADTWHAEESYRFVHFSPVSKVRARPMGCIMSTAIAVLVCKHKCSVSNLASKMAFHPPTPPSYTLEPQPDGTMKISFAHKDMDAALRQIERNGGLVKCEVRLLRTKRKQMIPLFHFKCQGARVHTLERLTLTLRAHSRAIHSSVHALTNAPACSAALTRPPSSRR